METNNKLREALAKILGIADHVQTRFAIPELANLEISELKQIAEAALAEPVRNCDVIGNTGRALVVHGFPTKSNQWGEGEWLEFIDWLFAPATEKKGEEK